jgi:hypothetical protein
MQLVEVSFTRQYEQLGPALPGISPAEKLLEVLMGSLEVRYDDGGGRGVGWVRKGGPGVLVHGRWVT